MNENKFYEDGLRFECTGCGACCKIHGDYAYVYMTPENIEEISGYLGLTRDEFYTAYCTEDDDGNVILTMANAQCNFLENDKCVVYPVRPAQCRAWPFLSEHLDVTCWNGVLREVCPGVGQGKLYTREEIEAIARHRDDVYSKSKPKE